VRQEVDLIPRRASQISSFYCDTVQILEAHPPSQDALTALAPFLTSAFVHIPAPAHGPIAFERFWRTTYHARFLGKFGWVCPERIKLCLKALDDVYGGEMMGGISEETESHLSVRVLVLGKWGADLDVVRWWGPRSRLCQILSPRLHVSPTSLLTKSIKPSRLVSLQPRLRPAPLAQGALFMPVHLRLVTLILKARTLHHRLARYILLRLNTWSTAPVCPKRANCGAIPLLMYRNARPRFIGDLERRLKTRQC
jgi:hypothetical protein